MDIFDIKMLLNAGILCCLPNDLSAKVSLGGAKHLGCFHTMSASGSESCVKRPNLFLELT